MGPSPSTTKTELKKLFNKFDFSESFSVNVESSLTRLEMPSLGLVLFDIYLNRTFMLDLAFFATSNSLAFLRFKTSLFTLFL